MTKKAESSVEQVEP